MRDPFALSRRQLLARCSLGAGALHAGALAPGMARLATTRRPTGSPERVAKDEDFWRAVRAEFELDSNRAHVNLAAGAYNACPRPVQSAFIRTTRFVNAMPGINRGLAFGTASREKLRARLARKLGASPNELAFTRGTTEALNIVIAGTPLQRGDEVITTTLDYASLRAAWRVRALRDGIRLTEVAAVPHPPDAPSELVRVVADAFTPRTKIVMICHITGANGQIFPVREICDMAHERGARVLVDGALAFGVVPVDVHALGCDYYGTSLHKGMYAPAGTGLLYIREGLAEEVLPLFGTAEPQSSDMRKYEEVGTQPIAPLACVNAALDFHEWIGTDRIRARLHDLKQRWMEILADAPNVVFHTSPDADQSCAIVNARIGDLDPVAVWRYLHAEHGISCYFSTEPFAGILVRLHVHTLRADVERCARILRDLAAHGIPDDK